MKVACLVLGKEVEAQALNEALALKWAPVVLLTLGQGLFQVHLEAPACVELLLEDPSSVVLNQAALLRQEVP